jgi:hypothetical protein
LAVVSSESAPTRATPSELMTIAKKTATSAPQKKAVASIQGGSGS